MAGETTITVIGNLTADPELRYTSSGIPVCSFRVASTPRVRNRQTGEWSDGDPLFLGCELWREAAENAGESLKKGMRVIVQGNLTQRSYQTQSGEQRTVFELKNCEVGPSLFRARAQVTRNERGGGGYGGGGGYQGGAGGYQGGSGGGYNNAGGQGGYNGGGQQPTYNAPAGGAPDDPGATGGPPLLLPALLLFVLVFGIDFVGFLSRAHFGDLLFFVACHRCGGEILQVKSILDVGDLV